MSTRSRFAVTAVVIAVLVSVALPVYAGNEAQVTYYGDVVSIIQNNCQTCHRPAGHNISGLRAPMSFMTYEETRPWARAIARKVESKEMPPWFASEPKGVFENERGLSSHEVDTIVNWVEAGAPAGDRTGAPAPLVFPETLHDGWSHGMPDFVVKIPEPYVVGDDDYDTQFSFDVPLTEDVLPEDTWVRGWELRTGAEGSGVHHMCAFMRPNDDRVLTGEGKSAVALGGLLSCVAEGGESGMLPEGYGVFVEKGSILNFNVHFNKEAGPGTSFTSQPEVGFFVEKRPVTHRVITDTLGNNGFEIPPNHPNYRVGMARTLTKDIRVINYWPHAHLRAKAARYRAYYPDGTEELLLDVPRYDQSWQVTYKYKEPKFLPKGTRIESEFWYDSTAERGARRNFDSDRGVGFGARTNDEMALGFIAYAEAVNSSQTTNQQDQD